MPFKSIEKRKEYEKKRNKTKWRLVCRIFYHQCQKSKRKGWPSPQYTTKRLYAWCMVQPKFHELHKAWVTSGYDKKLVPSVDRIDATKYYTFDNIQLMTWRENETKGYNENVEPKLGALKKWQKYGGLLGAKIVSRKIKQFSRSGKFIKEYKSLSSAARTMGVNVSNLCAVLKGREKTSAGYIWKYS